MKSIGSTLIDIIGDYLDGQLEATEPEVKVQPFKFAIHTIRHLTIGT